MSHTNHPGLDVTKVVSSPNRIPAPASRRPPPTPPAWLRSLGASSSSSPAAAAQPEQSAGSTGIAAPIPSADTPQASLLAHPGCPARRRWLPLTLGARGGGLKVASPPPPAPGLLASSLPPSSTSSSSSLQCGRGSPSSPPPGVKAENPGAGPACVRAGRRRAASSPVTKRGARLATKV